MNYSAGQAAKKLGVSKDTLRYYEKEGLLPPIQRDHSGHRSYSEGDVEWIFLIRCLRNTDMPMAQIKRYVALLKGGGAGSIGERRRILTEHQAFLEEKIASYQSLLGLIGKKLSFYDDALRSKAPEAAKCISYADEWEHFRRLLEGFGHD